jgi:hypothetical protein
MSSPLVIQEIVEINLRDQDFTNLAGAAGRISILLKLPKVTPDKAAVGCLDDFLGGVYALIFARLGGYTDRLAVPIEPDKVAIRAEQIAKGKVRTDGKWMAGFHFNSALFRIAAAYHRGLKVVLGDPKSREFAPALQPKAAALYRTWRSSDWQSRSNEAVYREVNDLKHTPQGVYEGRTVQFKEAVEAVEELLDLIETWALQP